MSPSDPSTPIAPSELAPLLDSLTCSLLRFEEGGTPPLAACAAEECHRVAVACGEHPAARLASAMAEKLARQTVIGSAALAAENPAVTPAALRENVTSPGGTTAAALEVLMARDGILPVYVRALQAAAKRAKELAG